MPNEAPKTNGAVGFKDGDGLKLTGIVVASEVVERSYEGNAYKQLKLTISSGVRSFLYTLTDKMGELPKVELFKRVRIDVESANSDKGGVTVRGAIAYE